MPEPRKEMGPSLLPPDAWPLLRSALGLSLRELQILQCVFDDQKQEAIAFQLGISPATVNTYFQRLYRKLRIASRTQLVVRVIAAYMLLGGAMKACSPENPGGAPYSLRQTTDE